MHNTGLGQGTGRASLALFFLLFGLNSAIMGSTSTGAFAVEIPSPRPKRLHCTATPSTPSATPIEFYDLDTQLPLASIDAKTELRSLSSESPDIEVNSFATQWCTHSADKRAYCFAFQTRELAQMAIENRGKTLALMSYEDKETESQPSRTVAIECQAK